MAWTPGDVSGSQTLTTLDHLYAGMLNELRVAVDGMSNVGYYNVKAYGAKGNGTTDDTTAINNAIAALPTEGGVVFFPHGVYIITSTITIKKHGVILQGEGWSSTFADQINQQPGLLGNSVIKASTSGWTSGNHMIVYGELGTNKMWTGGHVTGLVIYGPKGSITPGDCIQILNVQACRVSWCNLRGGASGVNVSSDQSGGVSNVVIEHNIVNDLTSIGIKMDTHSEQNYVRFNYISGYVQYGIYLNGLGNTVFNNHIESGVLKGSGFADGTAIFCSSAYSFVYCNDMQVGCPSHGIYLSGSHSLISNNQMTNVNGSSVANGSGVWVDGNISDVIVQGNLINDQNSKMVYGIRDTTSSSGAVLIGPNMISGFTTAAITSTNNILADLLFMSRVRTTVSQGTDMFQGYVGSNQQLGIRSTVNGTEIQSYSGASLLINNQGNKVAIGQTGPTAALDIVASATGAASLRLRSGVAPTSPNDGDIWFTGSALCIRISGVTKTFTVT